MKFIWGQETYLINREVKRLINAIGVEPTFYNEDSSVEDIALDINTINLFGDKKLIIIKNHPTLIKSPETKNILDILKKNNDSVEVIFTLETNKLLKSNDLVKYLISNADTKEFSRLSEKEIIPTIKDVITSKKGTISNAAAIKLAGKIPNDLRIIISEVEKLLLENNEINEKMVEVSIGEYLKDDAFGLSNAIIANDAHGILSSYKTKIANGDEPTVIIGQISSVFTLALKVAAFRKQGLSNSDISDKLSIHVFRIKKSSELISTTSPELLEKLIIDLAKLDKDIKRGIVDKDKGLEHFLLKLVK